MPRRLAAVERLGREIAAADPQAFNENGRFVEATAAVLGQVSIARIALWPAPCCLCRGDHSVASESTAYCAYAAICTMQCAG